jgi:hypothetical protein
MRKARITCSSGAGGVGSIPANSDAQNVPSFRRWRFEMKLSPPDNHAHETIMCKINQEKYCCNMPRVFARAACTCEVRPNRARQGVEPRALGGLPNTPNVDRSVLMPNALGSIDDLISYE